MYKKKIPENYQRRTKYCTVQVKMALHSRKGKVCETSIHTEADEISLNIYQNRLERKD
jgi:hypothetical protein